MLRYYVLPPKHILQFSALQITNGLQNFPEFQHLSPIVVCKKIREENVTVNLNIYLADMNVSGFKLQDLMRESLVRLSSSSEGFFDASILEVQNTGSPHLLSVFHYPYLYLFSGY